MKKRAMLLAGVLACSLMFTACGSSGSGGDTAEGVTEKETASGKETITLLSWYSEEQMGEFIDAFEKEQGIKVDLQYVPPVQQYVDKFSVLLASGQMTDMFYTAAENKQDVMEQGVAEDISDMEVFSRIDAKASSTYGDGTAIYAYSPDAWIGGIFYNKELFQKAGIEGEPQTWEEFVEDCKKLKEIGVEPYVDASDAVHNLPSNLYYSSIISQDPDTDRKINNGETTFVDQYSKPFETWYQDLVGPGIYSQVSLGLNSDQVIEMFATGQAAMIHGGPWTVNTIESKNPDLEYDIFGLKDSDGNCVLSGAVNVGLSISAASEKKDACRAFIEFMSRDENILKWQQITNNAIIVDGIDYEMGTIFDKYKEDAVNGNFYLGQIVWDNSAGIYKELLAGLQDSITGADTIDNVPARLDQKREELGK